jgi:hypothetical protein
VNAALRAPHPQAGLVRRDGLIHALTPGTVHVWLPDPHYGTTRSPSGPRRAARLYLHKSTAEPRTLHARLVLGGSRAVTLLAPADQAPRPARDAR